jgi:hypothetical protein
MHARVSKSQVPPERFDEGIRTIREMAIPMAKQIPGFVGGYWLGDRQTGQGRAVTFYSSAETLRDSADAAQRVRQEAANATGVQFQEIEDFEVIYDTGQKVHRDAGACRVVNFQADPSKLDTFVERARDVLVPALRATDGFQGGVWLANRNSGKGIGVTLFDTLEHVEASGETARRLIQETSAELGIKMIAVEALEVLGRAETPAGAPAG